jgi:hypothetical protein
VPQWLIDKFSRRTKQIEAEAERKGITDPDVKGMLGSELREKKAKHLSMDELRAHWLSQMTNGERGALADVLERAVASGARAPRVTAEQAMAFAIGKSFERRSSVPLERLVEEALRWGVGSVTPEQAWAEITGHGLITAEVRGRELATTEKLQQEEAHVMDFARRGRQACRPLVGPGRALKNDKLNDDQRQAVRYVWESGDRVMVVIGRQGVGKTTLLKEAAAGIEECGHRVLAFAPTTRAVRTLREEGGFPQAQTLAQQLVNPKLQSEVRGQVVLLDEAGQAGTEDFCKLFELADRLHFRCVIVGDDRQHKSVARGEPLQLLAAKVLPAVVVRKNMRQREHPEFQRVAVLLADGQTAEAFREMDRMGLIREVRGGERHQLVIDGYLETVAEKKKNGERKTALIEAPTHKEKDLVTAALRAALRARKQLTGKERELVRLVSLDLTEPERADPASYRGQGDVVLQVTQNAPGGMCAASGWSWRATSMSRANASCWRSPTVSRPTARARSAWPRATASVSPATAPRPMAASWRTASCAPSQASPAPAARCSIMASCWRKTGATWIMGMPSPPRAASRPRSTASSAPRARSPSPPRTSAGSTCRSLARASWR